jgi:hypothetical protein
MMPPVGSIARRSRKVSQRDIELFTELTGDRNPLHYDEQLAASTRFGGLIVQGGVTSGLLNAVVAEDLPGPGSVFLRVAWSLWRRYDRVMRSRPRSRCLSCTPPSRSPESVPRSPMVTASLFLMATRMSIA